MAALGEFAAPALRGVLEKNTATLEQRRRAEKLLARIEAPDTPPSCLRGLRGVEVLERIGSAEARKVLEAVAVGAADAWQTREARSVLARWR